MLRALWFRGSRNFLNSRCPRMSLELALMYSLLLVPRATRPLDSFCSVQEVSDLDSVQGFQTQFRAESFVQRKSNAEAQDRQR